MAFSMKLKRIILVLVFVSFVVMGFFGWRYFSVPRVSYLTLQTGEAVESLLVSGRVIGEGEVSLSFEQPGRIIQIKVGEGDQVVDGEILVHLDEQQAEDRLEQTAKDLNEAQIAIARIQNREVPQARESLNQASTQAKLAEQAYLDAVEDKLEPALDRLEEAKKEELQARRHFEKEEERYNNEEIDIDQLREAGREWDQARAELEGARSKEKEISRETDLLAAERDIAASRERSSRTSLASLENEEVRRATLRVEQAESAIKQARRDLERMSLQAPFNGVVTFIPSSVGQYVNTGQDILTIIPDSGRTYLEAQIDEEFAGVLVSGMEILVQSSAFPDRTFEGTVDRLSPTVDAERGTFKARFILDQNEPDLLPDLSVSIEVLINRREEGMVLEQSYTFRENDQVYVFVEENGQAARRAIEIEDLGQGTFLVVEGLTPGARVIKDLDLEDGQTVRLSE